MALPALQTFDGGTSGQAASAFVSGSYSWFMAASGTPATLQTAAAIHGALGLRFTDLTHAQTLTFSDGTARATSTQSGYFVIRTTPGTQVYVASMNDAAAKVADFRINTNLTLTIRNLNAAAASSVAALSAGTVYRYEWTISGATQSLSIFIGESSTPLFTITGGTNGNPIKFYNEGCIAAAGTGAIDFDTFQVTATPPGPFVVGSGVYDRRFLRQGGVWVPHTVGLIVP
jgi:hypothetical protein